MSDFNSLVQYTVENISRPIKYIIYKLTEFIRVVDKFIFRQVPAGAASGYANIEKVEGNTVAWNQLVKNGKFTSSQNWAAESGVTTSIGDNVINITKTSSSNIGIYQLLQAVANHIYYVTLDAKSNASTTVRFTAGGSNLRVDTLLDEGVWTHICSITTTTSNTNQIYIYQSETPTTLSVTNVQLIDLTAIFGAGNEPTTVADFEAWLAQNIGTLPYYDYNAGELLSVKMSGMQTEDSSQQTLDTLALDVTTITGINTATNVREVIFPNGMKQADQGGTVKDMLDLRSDTATVKVGSRAYQSGDESDTTVITDGTTTYYALTTPITYTDLQDANGNPLNPRYKVEQGGTEQVLPANTVYTLCDQTQLIANSDYNNNGDLRPKNGRYATKKINVRNLNKIKISYTADTQLYTAYCTYNNQSLVERNSQWLGLGTSNGVLDVSNVDEVSFFFWYSTQDVSLPTISALAVDTIPPTTVAPTLTTTYTKA